MHTGTSVQMSLGLQTQKIEKKKKELQLLKCRCLVEKVLGGLLGDRGALLLLR